jgi:hypothetical protein
VRIITVNDELLSLGEGFMRLEQALGFVGAGV